MKRPRILFVSESVTLAHAARPFVLASALDPARTEVALAWDPRFAHLFPTPGFRTYDIDALPTATFNEALRRGTPFFKEADIRRSFHQDRALIEAFRPDLIVGDFRLSLTLSGPASGVPVHSIASPYWSPQSTLRPLAPDNPLSRFLPGALVDRVAFPLVFPWAERAILAPFQKLRRELGLPPMVGGLRELYTAGDVTLFDGLPELAPLRPGGRPHVFLGPVLWSPAAPLPAWWDEVPTDRPCVYLSLGTSGDTRVLDCLLDALERRGVSVLLSTAGGGLPRRFKNLYTAPFLPGRAAAARADAVISNGGAGAVQALAEGRPVLGLASNLDQVLSMQGVVGAGAGILRRTFQATEASLNADLDRLMTDVSLAARARAVAERIHATPAGPTFAAWLETALQNPQAHATKFDRRDRLTKALN
jgi:UDP:flavonoid glycosyltransferase YjiC (YdhE family)